MRAGVGLVGLLVTVGVIVWVFSMTSIPTAKVGKDTQDQARKIAGRDQNGDNATDAVTLDVHQRGGRSDGVIVTSIIAGSDIEKAYGLQKDDVITQAGDMPFGDTFTNDADTAKALLLEAFKASKPLDVVRAGQKMKLPLPPGSAPVSQPATASPTAPATGQPQPPAAQQQPPAAPSKDPLQRQLDLIKKGNGQE